METSSNHFKNHLICSLLNIDYPIIQAGMVWCSGYRLAAASAEAGILGVLGAGSMTPELLRSQVRKVKAITNNSFAVNIPIFYQHAAEVIDVIIDEEVKYVITSGGNPKIYTEKLKKAGLVVLHVVSSLKFAVKAEAAGVDAIIAEGFEAGGHNGKDETTTFCLIPPLAKALQVPLIAAGGIASGQAMLAAQVLGASGVQIGSAFAIAKESSAHENFKQAVLNAKEGDTRLQLKKLTPVRMLKNDFSERIFKMEAQGEDDLALKAELGKGRSRLGIMEGDLKEGELEIGQASAHLDKVQSVQEIVDDIVNGYFKALKRIN